MQDLKVILVQSDTIWESVQANLNNFDRLLKGQLADLVVLPETFSTGFSMNSKTLAEPINGSTVVWMKHAAQTLNAVITGSVIISEGENIFNRLLWVAPDGQIQFYDKRHLFGLLGETNHYSPGHERKIFTVKGWRVCPQVCYDLRFPVWCRNREDYDLLMFVANWPASRAYAWNTLAHARAIENQCYVVATNRVGKDGNGLQFGGGSLAIDPLGKTLQSMNDTQSVCAVTLKFEDLTNIRAQFPFLKDRDAFSIQS